MSFLIILTQSNMIIFILSFAILVPIYETIGAAISVLIASVISSLLLLLTNAQYDSLRYVKFTCLSVIVGFVVGHLLNLKIGTEEQFLTIIPAVVISIVVIFLSKNMTIKETKFILNSLLQKL